MLTLTIRTDKPEAEIGLFADEHKLGYKTWRAHRELSVTLHKAIEEVVQSNNYILEDIDAIVCFSGPGSFTGLRIGITVANALAESLGIKIVAANGDKWIHEGMLRLESGWNDRVALPVYGAEAFVTQPRK